MFTTHIWIAKPRKLSALVPLSLSNEGRSAFHRRTKLLSRKTARTKLVACCKHELIMNFSLFLVLEYENTLNGCITILKHSYLYKMYTVRATVIRYSHES